MAAANSPSPVEPKYGGTLDRSHKGEAAPTAGFTDLAGKKASIADFKNRPVLLNLWATWCAPCIKEMPTLDALAGSKGESLVVLPVSQDYKGKEVVDPFLAKAGYKHLKPYLDTEMALSTGMNATLPTTILYDSTGKEVWRMSGDYDWSGEKAAALIAEAK